MWLSRSAQGMQQPAQRGSRGSRETRSNQAANSSTAAASNGGRRHLITPPSLPRGRRSGPASTGDSGESVWLPSLHSRALAPAAPPTRAAAGARMEEAAPLGRRRRQEPVWAASPAPLPRTRGSSAAGGRREEARRIFFTRRSRSPERRSRSPVPARRQRSRGGGRAASASPSSDRARRRPRDGDRAKRSTRDAIRNALDAELDASCGRVFEDFERAASKGARSEADPGLSLAEIATQVRGLAEVRTFVDEQLTADLSTRTRACKELAKTALAKRGHGASRADARGASPAASLFPAGMHWAPSGKLALAPFRSASRSLRR